MRPCVHFILFIFLFLLTNQELFSKVEKPDTLVPKLEFTMDCSSGQINGVVTDMPDEDSIRVNLYECFIMHNDNFEFSCDDIEAGIDRTANWTLFPIDKAKYAICSFFVSDYNGNERDTTIIWGGYFPGIVEDTLDFGVVQTGREKALYFWLKNYSSDSVAIVDSLISEFEVENHRPSKFYLEGVSFPLKIQPDDSIRIKCKLNSTKIGSFTDKLQILHKDCLDDGPELFAEVIEQKKDTLPPKPEWAIDYCEREIINASVKDEPNVSYIRANLGSIKLDMNGSYNYIFSRGDFEPGIDKSTTWELRPDDITKDMKAVITFTDFYGNDTTITIELKGFGMDRDKFNPIDMGTIEPNQEHYFNFEIENPSSEHVIIDTFFLFSEYYYNKGRGFQLNHSSYPVFISSEESHTFYGSFISADTGSYVDTLGFLVDSCILWNTEIKTQVMQAESVEDDFNKSIKITPNPADDFIDIYLSDKQFYPGEISIISMEGNIIGSYVFPGADNKHLQINTSGFPSGIYLLKIICKNKILTKKFTIVK